MIFWYSVCNKGLDWNAFLYCLYLHLNKPWTDGQFLEQTLYYIYQFHSKYIGEHNIHGMETESQKTTEKKPIVVDSFPFSILDLCNK